MAGKTDKNQVKDCPCGGGLFAKCCGRFISGAAIPDSAEQLMRSRYTAFSLRDEAYLKSTWASETLPDDAVSGEDDVKWIGLNIVKHKHLRDSDLATVEFIARFKVGGRAHRLHEVSNFERREDEQGNKRWYYVDGSFPDDE
ncbi:YchJ family metal-binding protein [Herbaspirillum lusitanum]|uniref:YchJ family metal-binding protein n=1 Tax=Herbaspirillum lusitanum TaxID=213312 RepID=A0ABW9A7W7_9BURK